MKSKKKESLKKRVEELDDFGQMILLVLALIETGFWSVRNGKIYNQDGIPLS